MALIVASDRPALTQPPAERGRDTWLAARVLAVGALAAVAGRLPGAVGARAAAAEVGFVSLVAESLPFLLVGALLATVAHGQLAAVARLAGRRPRASVLLAPVCGLVLPLCDCGLVPLARALRTAGAGRAVTSFVAGAPLTNPVVILTTLLAFPGRPGMLVGRVLLGACVAVLVALVVPAPRRSGSGCCDHGAGGDQHQSRSRMLSQEIARMTPTLVVGAGVAAMLKAAVPTGVYAPLSAHPLLGVAVLMGLAVVMSICSQADAFVAASLPVDPMMQLAFMLVGPALNLRLAALYGRDFGGRWLLGYAAVLLPVAFVGVVVWSMTGLA
jgi:uncharacterized protein